MSRIIWGVETDPVTIIRKELIEIAKTDLYVPLWVSDPVIVEKQETI